MTIIAVILVLVGVLGSMWGPDWLVAISFLGLFGPYILCEAGVMPWRDDYQRETVMRAGMHALIVTGMLLVVVQAVQGVGGSGKVFSEIVPADNFPTSVIFYTMVLTWGLSWLIQFWGVKQGSFRILAILAGSMTLLITVPLIVAAIKGHSMGFHAIWPGYAQLAWIGFLAFTSRRWPRFTSLALTGTVIFALWTFFRSWNQGLTLDVSIIVLNLMVVPLMVPAIALITHRRSQEEECA